MAHSIKPRIMYIECKGGGFVEMYGQLVANHEASLTGPARIGRVTFNRTGNTLFYDGKRFHCSEVFKSNYVCEEPGALLDLGTQKRGGDALYSTNITTKIDEDVREEYWTHIRNSPERVKETETL